MNGPRLLIGPSTAWRQAVGRAERPASWLIAAALTAAVWPAVSVVLGHLGSAALGRAPLEVAVLRAAVGFTAAVGGALVMAPAFTLILLWLCDAARGAGSTGMAASVAMGLLWPAWAAGAVLAFPPLVGMGPSVGEILWAALAGVAVFRATRAGAAASLSVRRRWMSRFVSQTTAAFLALFLLVSIGPAAAVRSMLHLEAAGRLDPPARPDLPLPPEPDW